MGTHASGMLLHARGVRTEHRDMLWHARGVRTEHRGMLWDARGVRTTKVEATRTRDFRFVCVGLVTQAPP
jgi:hypothetical protein